MALTSTVYNFDIDLADADRGVYESLALRVARHPSEPEEFLLTRVLAYCLELQDGLEFSAGLCVPDEPALRVRDLTGALRAWIEVGAPDAARLHRAAKASPRVVVYNHKDPGPWLDRLAAARIHRAEELELWSMDRGLLARLCEHLQRRTAFSLSVAERELFVSVGDRTLTGATRRLRLV